MHSTRSKIVLMQDPLETAELLAFARTVQAQSLTRAAAELKLPRATVSRRLQRLEERLGVRLLRRTTRRLALTDAGEVLYRHARLILDAVRDAELSVQRTDAVRGRLRISVPPVTPMFQGLLCDFIERYPDVRLEVHASARHVDLIAEGYDLALRAGVAPDSGLVGRTLYRQRLTAVASPAYLARRGTPQSGARTAPPLLPHGLLTRGAAAEPLAAAPRRHRARRRGAVFERYFSPCRGGAPGPRHRAPAHRADRAVHRKRRARTGAARGAWRADAAHAGVPGARARAPAVRAFIDAVVAWAAAGIGWSSTP